MVAINPLKFYLVHFFYLTYVKLSWNDDSANILTQGLISPARSALLGEKINPTAWQIGDSNLLDNSKKGCLRIFPKKKQNLESKLKFLEIIIFLQKNFLEQ